MRIHRSKPEAGKSDDKRHRPAVLEKARGGAAAAGGVVGVGLAFKELVWDDGEKSFSDVWGQMATSTIGLAAIALLASVAALVSRFASPAPSLADLATLSADERAEWTSLSAEAQAWREFVGDIIPTAVVGASFGFAIVALVSQVSHVRWFAALLVFASGVALFVAAVTFLSRRRAEIERQLGQALPAPGDHPPKDDPSA